jgi:hypothetical protein
MRKDLPLLAIESVEELQRFYLKRNTTLDNTRELSKLVKEDFSSNPNYSLIFSKAYSETYLNKTSPKISENKREYYEEISQKLKYPENLNEQSLTQLINFCINLSNYSASYEKHLESLRGPCFG